MPPLTHATTETSLGRLLLARTDAGLVACFLGDDDAALEGELAESFPDAPSTRDESALATELAASRALVEDPGRTDHGLLPVLDGTDFQVQVWRALMAVPAGETITYAELARRMGQPPGAAQAIGAACAANRLALLVPCHRAVRSDGSLADFRWGLARKRTLLDREAKYRRDPGDLFSRA